MMKREGALSAIMRRLISSEVTSRVLLFFVIGMALVLRLYHLGLPSLWLDEQGQALAATNSIPKLLAIVQKHHGAAPLDYIVTMITVHITHDLFFLRLPAAIWGTLSVYWTYRLGSLLDSKYVGILAAFFSAFHVFLLRYSQELRFYSLFIFLTLVSMELAWRAWVSNRPKDWVFYGVVLVAMFYTHYFGLLVAFFQGLWMLFETIQTFRTHGNVDLAKQKLLRFLMVVILAFLLFLPWILFDFLNEKGLSWVSPPPLNTTLWTTILFVFGGRSQIWWIWTILAVIGLISSIKKQWTTGVTLGIMLVGIPLIAVLIDRFGNYFFHPRQVIILLPFYLILVAWGIITLVRMALALDKLLVKYLALGGVTVLLGGILAFALPGIYEYYTVRQILREDIGLRPLTHVTGWRDAAILIEENWQPGDTLLFFQKNDGTILRFYLPENLRDKGVVVSDMRALQRKLASSGYVWIVYSSGVKDETEKAMISWLNQQPIIDFPLIGGIHLVLLKPGSSKEDLWVSRVSRFIVPDQAELWAAFAQGIRTLDHERAQQAFEKAADLTPFSRSREDYYISGEYITPPSSVPPKITVKTRADYLMEAGLEAVWAGNIEQAIYDLKEARSLAPDDPEILIRLGLAYIKDGRPHDAVSVLEYARDVLGARGYWLFYFLGRAYYDSGDYLRSADAYQQALKIRPEAHEVRFFIAEAYRHGGNKKLARYWYRDYLKHAPNGQFAQKASAFLEEDF